MPSVEKIFSKSTPETTTYVNKTIANGPDDCDQICQDRIRLRQLLSLLRQPINLEIK